jgi:hypothetical protein
VTHIGYKAFYRCTYLAEIHIPDSVASIGGGVLCGCGLGSRNIRITSDNHHLQIIYSDSSKDAGILVFDDKLFSAFGKIRSIVIPSFVKHIGDGAFSRCANLHSITIPDSVISIGKNAFYRCDFLNHIILPDSITSISEKAFYKCKGPVICVYDKIKRSQTFQYQIRYDGTAHIVGCTDRVSTNIHIPHRLDGHRVISLGDELFKGFGQLKDVTIPQGIEYIGNNFCMGCFALQKLTIPGTVRYIGSNICHSCRSLEYVDLQNGIKEIGSHAFNDCKSLCNVRFPNSVEWIYGMPFHNSPVTLILSNSSDLWNSTGMNLHEKYDIPYTLGI